MPERSYDPVARRVEALADQGRKVETIGVVEGHPVFCIRAGRPRRLRILLTGGVHGDEPAGVEAVLRFFEEDAEPWLGQVEFIALPCVNPVGYVRGTRENGAGADINRSFESGGVPEVDLVKKVLEGCRLDAFVDCHEDWEADGFYMYEGLRQGPAAGPAVIAEVAEQASIDPDSGEDSEPVSPGVYEISPSWGLVGFAPHVLNRHAPRACIFETPTKWPLEKRAAVHRVGLGAALRHWTGETGVSADHGVKRGVRKPCREAVFPLKSRPGP
ncbi:MAG: M14 family metallocarboxypeptidase [Gemmatimonadetes bacterium]|nr:M14 family metallocarboxypeptidase [Gemmatimonadota bacterium]